MDNLAITILGIALIFVATTAGAAMVYLLKKDISPRINTIILGFAAGVMVAAAIWSLLIPAIEGSSSLGVWKWAPAVIGFVGGGLFMVLIDKIVPHFHKGTNEDEGVKRR